MTPAAAKRRRHAWMLLCLAPLGFGAWVPLVAGLRARRPLWIALGIVFCAVAIAGFILSSVTPDDEDGSFAGMLILIPWVAAAATTLAIYPSYRRRRALLDDVEQREESSERRRLVLDQEIERREHERERARELVRRDPVAALERGIGRPDVRGADHCELVDVNHAPAAVLQTLPAIDADLARRIVATRENVGRFSSVADLGFVLDLDPDTTARLERVAIAIDA
jgi:4-amino-4-deoxy-L-arabinose transferase-like glycosyltransferase